jgi:alkyl hydroperoxide reductase subunit AhpC
MATQSSDKPSDCCADKSKSSSCPLLPGDAAPNFVVSACSAGHIKTADLAKFKKNSRPVILLFYPESFDLLLAGELAQLQAAGLREQLPSGTVLMAASTDTVEAGQAWAELEVEKGGLKGSVSRELTF